MPRPVGQASGGHGRGDRGRLGAEDVRQVRGGKAQGGADRERQEDGKPGVHFDSAANDSPVAMLAATSAASTLSSGVGRPIENPWP